MNDTRRNHSALGYVLVVLATAGWGASGLFIKAVMRNVDISPVALAFWRDLSTFICLFIGIAVVRPAWLRVQRRDLLPLAGLGVFSIGTFHVFWNVSVQTNGVAVATVLQEAAPALVALAAWLFLRESITKIKVAAIIITFAGCVLASRPDLLMTANYSVNGVLIGLVSAITYGSFSLFGKRVTGNYTPWTVLMYGFGFAALVLFPVQFFSPGPWPILAPAARWWFVGLIALPTIASFAMYTLGLRWMAASVAAIVATSEVAFAVLYAYVLLGERLHWMQVLGALLVVGGVIVLSLPGLKAKPATQA